MPSKHFFKAKLNMFQQKKSSNKTVVQWVGEQISIENKPKQLEKKEVKFYKKCIFGSMSISVGDFVLVSNADSAEQDLEGCDVGRILYLFQIFEPLLATRRDPYRAIVQWYSRPKDIQEKYFDNDTIAIDFDREVIESHEGYSDNISIETIFKKCIITLGDESNSVDELFKKRKPEPMFVCRYKIVRNGARSFKLVCYNLNSVFKIKLLIKLNNLGCPRIYESRAR